MKWPSYVFDFVSVRGDTKGCKNQRSLWYMSSWMHRFLCPAFNVLAPQSAMRSAEAGFQHSHSHSMLIKSSCSLMSSERIATEQERNEVV